MIQKVIPLLCILTVLNGVRGFLENNPVVVTKVGRIRGIRAKGENYTMFLGIPYAKVNETFPFGDILPVPSFEGVFEAYDDSVVCPQRIFGNIIGSLDCLHVNIHVPDSAGPDNLLPVMIYIFGGMFAFGGPGRSLTDPKYLVRKDVIFVAIGSRQGPYGFMCLDIPEVPGNFGLKDQEKAFDWIRNNIESFGGDVNRMTLFGHSSGAISAGFHLFSDTKKVYRNVILQSGSSLVPTSLHPGDPELPLRLAAKLGIKTNDIYEALNFLAKVPPHDVIAVDDPNPYYRPCVEKIFPGVTALLPDYPLNLKSDNSQGLTILQGYTTDEKLYSITKKETFVSDLFMKELTSFGRFNFKGKILDEAATLVRHFYIGDEEVNKHILYKISDFLSDLYFVFPATRSIPKYFEEGVAKIYQYVFSHDGDRCVGKIFYGIKHLPGVAHADCLAYVLDMQNFTLPEPVGKDELVLDMMTTLWTNFAKYNDPTPETTKLLPVKWKPITQGSPEYYMEINSTLTLGKAHLHQRKNFWRLFYKSYQQYQTGYNYTREYSKQKPTEDNIAILISIITVLFIGIVTYVTRANRGIIIC